MSESHRKSPGPKRAFSRALELRIAKDYLLRGLTAEEVAGKYRARSRTGRLSASGVRTISVRYREDLIPATA